MTEIKIEPQNKYLIAKAQTVKTNFAHWTCIAWNKVDPWGTSYALEVLTKSWDPSRHLFKLIAASVLRGHSEKAPIAERLGISPLRQDVPLLERIVGEVRASRKQMIAQKTTRPVRCWTEPHWSIWNTTEGVRLSAAFVAYRVGCDTRTRIGRPTARDLWVNNEKQVFFCACKRMFS